MICIHWFKLIEYAFIVDMMASLSLYNWTVDTCMLVHIDIVLACVMCIVGKLSFVCWLKLIYSAFLYVG